MTDHATSLPAGGQSVGSLIYDPKARSIFFQVATIAIMTFIVWTIANNTIENLARSNTATGYDFLKGRAGFDIGQTLIS